MRFLILLALLLVSPAAAWGEDPAILLRPARVFDGVDPRPHEGWSVLVRGERIEAVGPSLQAPAGTRVVDLPGMTLMRAWSRAIRTSSSIPITKPAGTIRS